MEFAFKYGIWEFLKHNLTSETQLLAATWHATVLIFDIYMISSKSYKTEIFCNLSFLKGVQLTDSCIFPFNLCVVHLFKKHKSQKKNVKYDM